MMDTIFSIARDYEMYIRVVVSAILGFLIGWDREAKNKPAGLKTYMYGWVAYKCYKRPKPEDYLKLGSL